MLPISVVICTLNSQDTILEVVQSLKKCDVAEIIIVDGRSKDSTIAKIDGLECKVVFDEQRGLAAARNIGIRAAQQKYILFCGADNVLNHELVLAMFQNLDSNTDLAGIGCRTRVRRSGYLSTMLDIQWSARVISGDEIVLGTPCIFETELISRFFFDESRTWSDDEELCQRIKRVTGRKFQVINQSCLEIGQDNVKRLFYRFKGYGRSDFEVYSANKNHWNTRRKFRSFLHPFDSEIIKVFARVSLTEFLGSLPLLLFATVIRYFSWVSLALKRN